MPQRFLRPGIRTSPRWNAVSHRAARLYVAILTLVDDYGRYDGRPSVLWADAFAVWNEQNPQFAVNPQETAADCTQLAAALLVEFYEVGGRRYLQVIQWQETPRSASKWPDPPQESARNPQRNPAESSGIQPPSSSSSPPPSSSPSPSPTVKASGGRKPRNLEEFLAVADRAGLPPEDAKRWYADCELCDWKRGDGTPFDNWQRQLCIHRDKIRANGEMIKQKSGNKPGISFMP